MGGSGGQWPGPLFREETVSEDPLYMHGQRWVQLGLWCWTKVVGAPLARPVPPGHAETCSDLPLPPPWTQALAVLCGGILCPRPGRGFVLQPLSLPPLVIERAGKAEGTCSQACVYGTPCWCLSAWLPCGVLQPPAWPAAVCVGLEKRKVPWGLFLGRSVCLGLLT